VQFFYHLFLYVLPLPLEIQLSTGDSWYPINWFNPATFCACLKPGTKFPTSYHSIDASYQVSVHLAKRFWRRFFFKSANQKQELPEVAMFVNGSGQNEQSL
jgi:hypothetical protein